MPWACYLSRDQEIYFTAVIFIIGKAFVDLRASNLRETSRKRIDRFAILEQADNIVDAHPSFFNVSCAAADAGVYGNVAVRGRLNRHIRMVVSRANLRKTAVR